MDDVEREDRDVHLIVALACVPVVIGQVLERGAFDGGSTACLAGLACVILVLVRRRRRPALPRARVVR